MYNLYSKEKEEKEFIDKNEKIKRDEKIVKKKKKISSKLIENYNIRTKNFILEMAKNPIIIQNHNNPIESFRTEFFQDGELKANRFIFNPFQTEKERIEKFLSSNKNKEYKNIEIIESIKRKDSVENFIQPQMRFKARNHIERIFDVINEQSYGKVDKRIIISHLKTSIKSKEGVHNKTEYIEQQLPKYLTRNILNLNKEREKNNEFGDDDEKRFFNHTDKNLFNEKIKTDNLMMKTANNFLKNSLTATNQDGIKSKNILTDYHMKTHFKGVSNLAILNYRKQLNLQDVNNNKIFKDKNESKLSLFKSKNLKKDLPQNSFNLNNEKISSLLNDEGTKDIILNCASLYNENVNENSEEKNYFNKDTLQILKKISEKPFLKEEQESIESKSIKKKFLFQKQFNIVKSFAIEESNLSNFRLKGNLNREYHDNLENSINKKSIIKFTLDDDVITFNNKEYNIDQIETISKDILKKCNYYHYKKNNNTMSLLN